MFDDRDCFVVNMVACEEKVANQFLHGDFAPTGVVDISVEDVKKKVEEGGSRNPVIIKMEKIDDENDDNDYILFVCLDDLSEGAPSQLVFSAVHSSAASAVNMQQAKLLAVCSRLSSKCSAIGHCFEAFPLLIEEVKKQGRCVLDSLVDEIAKKQGEFNVARLPIATKLTGKVKDLKELDPVNVELTKWNEVIFNFLKEIFNGRPAPAPIIPAHPDPVPSHPVPVGPDPRVKELQAKIDDLTNQLGAANKLMDDLRSELKAKDAEIAELKKKVDELTPKPIVLDPKIVGTEIVFEPKKKGKPGKEEIIFMTIKGYFKYYLLDKALVASASLDPTKPATCCIERYSSHCHTEEPEQSRLAEEYYVPKGEDFFICGGKVWQ